MAGANLKNAHVPRAVDSNGAALSGALLYVYEVGTTTEVTTYSDIALTSANPFPVVADAAGSWGSIYVQSGIHKIDVTNSAGTSLAGYPVDNVDIFSFLGTLNDADAAAARLALGLGTAALKDTGTSGDTLGLLNASADWSGAFFWSGKISPAQITGNVNNYNPSGLSDAVQLRLNSDASRNVTGLSGGGEGRVILITNIGSFDIVLPNQDAGSSAANRFLFAGGDLTLTQNESVLLRYDGVSSRWRAAHDVIVIDPFSESLLHVRDQKTSGTDGGTFTSGAWRTRTLNTTITNEISGASLSSNQITLPAGTYWIDARAPAHFAAQSSNHQAKLRNVTDNADVLIGSSMVGDANNDSTTDSIVSGRFTLSGTKTLEIQHRAGPGSQSSTGFGGAAGFGVVEVYAEVKIWQMAGTGGGGGGGGGPISAIHGARVYQNVSNSSITSGGVVLNFDKESFDPQNLHDNSSNNERITVDIDGYWEATAELSVLTAKQYTFTSILFRLDGTTVLGAKLSAQTVGINVQPALQVVTGPIFLTAGQYIEVIAGLIPTGDSEASEFRTWFSMRLVGT